MRRYSLSCLLISAVFATSPLKGQSMPSEQVQIGPPPMRRAEPPAAGASAEELEKKADELRGEKNYLDAIDYYRGALSKAPTNAEIHNKIGVADLQLRRYRDARRDFERAVHLDQQNANYCNNLGVVFYEEKKYGKAISQYGKAITLQPDSASFYNNLGAVYFAKQEYDKAVDAFGHAVRIDPEIFERTSHNGVIAQVSSQDDRAHYDYVLAKMFAKAGDSDHSLLYLRRALEEGYKGIDGVFKDAEFAGIRKDARFTQLMASRPPAIPE